MQIETRRHRWLSQRLPRPPARRIVVLTGARQTGKTTLARALFRDLPYFSLDDVELRATLDAVRTADWHRDVGIAVLDEAQKLPELFDKVKFAFDEGNVDFTVLLGSSRFLLMDRVRESLAGRAFVYDLWPLMVSEVIHEHDSDPTVPLFDQLLDTDRRIDPILEAQPRVLIGKQNASRLDAVDHLATWGGMPELLRLEDPSRRDWLKSYQQTFLERDLADLVRLADLQPFRKLQKLCMLRTAGQLSFSDLGRDAGLGATTARRYVEYLRMSYQVFLLQPYATNLTSSVVKNPKLYWMDLGLLRHETLQLGPLDGRLFETLVVGEARKWIDTAGKDVELTYYRTRSGMEVDLLIRTPHGVLGIEIKNRETVEQKDLRGLRAVAAALGDDWLGGLVVYRGNEVDRADKTLSMFAMPVHRLF